MLDNHDDDGDQDANVDDEFVEPSGYVSNSVDASRCPSLKVNYVNEK